VGSEKKSAFAKSKRPYTKPEVKKIKPADAKKLLEEKPIPDDAGTREVLKQVGLIEGITNARTAEIQRELEKLYAQLEEFSDPTPADQPHEYELEELVAFEKLREQIRTLENELEEITRQQS
jgi:hypothetical protein